MGNPDGRKGYAFGGLLRAGPLVRVKGKFTVKTPVCNGLGHPDESEDVGIGSATENLAVSKRTFDGLSRSPTPVPSNKTHSRPL